MKDKINKRWAVVGLIWAGVIFLTWWNVDTMDRIRSPRERIEISHTEMQFVQYNSENISSVLKKKALFWLTQSDDEATINQLEDLL